VVKVDNQGTPPPAYEPPKLDMATALPPEYRDKPHFKGKDFISLVKEHDNLQKLIGSRPAGIPGETATPEEWDKFLGALKPKDVNEYKLPETEFSKANKRSPEYEKAIREIMAEAGMTKHGFPKAVNKIEEILFNAQKEQAKLAEAAKVSRETEFDGLINKTFGQQRQAVLDRTKSLMSEAVSPEHKELVQKAMSDISNDALFALTMVLDGVHKKYIAEDNLTPGGNAGADVVSMQREAEEIMKSSAYRDWRDAGHEAAKAKVQELFRGISAAQSKR
jgi:hypothetical protein